MPTEFDGGFPKLLVDHWGFSLQLKSGARRIETAEGAAMIFSKADLECLYLLSGRIPEKGKTSPRG
jgi:hypothetical protein